VRFPAVEDDGFPAGWLSALGASMRDYGVKFVHILPKTPAPAPSRATRATRSRSHTQQFVRRHSHPLAACGPRVCVCVEFSHRQGSLAPANQAQHAHTQTNARGGARYGTAPRTGAPVHTQGPGARLRRGVSIRAAGRGVWGVGSRAAAVFAVYSGEQYVHVACVDGKGDGAQVVGAEGAGGGARGAVCGAVIAGLGVGEVVDGGS